ncbi:MAG: TRAP transporter fused permease subunit [Rhodopseudomonas sp.]|nr:TRAP transporter fused permease subunit [Rhodopseudomonas sp.]
MIVNLLFETGVRRPLSPSVRAVTKAYAAILAVWVLYNVIITVSDIFGMTFIFLAAMLALVFVTLAPTTRSTSIDPGVIDWTLAALSLATGAYFWWNLDTIANRITLFDELTPWEFGMGLLTVLLVLEATRRSVGAGLTFIVLTFIAYNLLGHHLSGEISHGYISLHHFVDTTVYTTDAIYGVPVRVAATYAFLFVLFGTILERAGGGEFFYRVGALVAGRTVGGTAKIAIVSSGAYGMVSGSPVADVVTTGAVTIPAMENAGYRSSVAGGIEVAASTGGSIMPPVMGSVAFIMSEYTGIPYGQIAMAAVIPAILYYLGVFVQVHYMSKKLGMKSLSNAEIPTLVQALKRGELFVVPLTVIVGTLAYGYAATYAAAFGSLAVFLVALLRKETRIDLLKLYDVLSDSTIKVIGVTAACAAAGLVIGGLSMTGLAAKFSALIALASGNSLFISLFISAAVTILLGMGMPTPSVYILAAALVAPVLLKLHVSLLAANMFLLYFSVLSASTPPVAVAAYAAAAIARANPISISVIATRLSVAAAIVPFSFAYSPELLLQGAWFDVAMATGTAIIGVYLVGVATEGYLNAPISGTSRILIGLAGLCFVAPSMLLAAVGTALAVLGFAPTLYPRLMLRRGN